MDVVKAKVYLLGYSMPVNTTDFSTNPERIVAAAGKLCYSKSNIITLYDNLDDQKAASFIEMLTNLGHESPLEHISFTFGVEGISRACSHQIVRHRMASYSQQSQRYVDLKDTFSYVIPDAIMNNEEAKKIYIESIEKDIDSYNKIVISLVSEYTDGITDEKEKLKLTKKALEDARFALPNACETKIIVTMNARSLINFFGQRCCKRAQWEIKEVADQMLDIVLDIAPHVFMESGAPCVFGKCKEGAMSCGERIEPRDKQKRMMRNEG